MNEDRLFLDTSFVLALLDRRDQYHARALVFVPRIEAARALWITEAILIELANALSAADRSAAMRFIEQCDQDTIVRVVSVETSLLKRACRLYSARPDKT